MLRHDNWGWRARFGLFIVSSEAVPEAEWWAMMPAGTSVHAARIHAAAPWANWRDDNPRELKLADDLVRGAQHFAAMRLDAVVIGHSSSSILGGDGWDNAVVLALRQLLPEVMHISSNGLDCLAALQQCGVERPFLVFPPWFNPALVDAGVAYFSSQGFSPAGSLSVDPGRQWRDIPPEQLYPRGMGFEQDIEYLYRQIRAATPQEADGVLIVGTGFRCIGIAEALENDLARPVITANQASLWHCLRASGINACLPGYGRLLNAD